VANSQLIGLLTPAPQVNVQAPTQASHAYHAITGFFGE
jgi:hypothetical protein